MDQIDVHATCVAWQKRAVLITGASGTGKSGLALNLMGMGCKLVADDKVILTSDGAAVTATCPPVGNGMIEARGIGVLRADTAGDASVLLVVDLDQEETKRLPAQRHVTMLGCDLPLIYKVSGPHFAAAILQFLKAGRVEA